MGLSGELAAQYSAEYPGAATRTLANKLYREQPEVYPTLNAAQVALRRVRGQVGEKGRRESADKSQFREAKPPVYDMWAGLPEPIGDFSEAMPFDVPESRILVLSDIHFPFYDREALITALEYGQKFGANAIILNGDILDCYALSRFVVDPRLRDFGKELEQTRTFLQVLRKEFSDARIYYRRGNHEARYETYMMTKAPELLGISELFSLKNVLGLEALGISWHEERDYFRIGRLNVLHGHEFGKGGGVNAARWLFLKAQSTALIGHFHRVDAHSGRNMEGRVTSTWATGCLCGLSPDYLRYNNWSHGFATVESDGYNFSVENKRIIEGRIY